ncbi:MAG TPA: hypothetical protein VLA21_00635, partial [Candidatus Limnocylindria bacterium]|nr:hypothetical protein [Candidatus Limnocylindria bacterium]
PAVVLSTLSRPGTNPSRVLVSASSALMDDAILKGDAFLNRRLLVHLFSGFGGGADVSNFTGKDLNDTRVHIPSAAATTLGIMLAVVLPLALFGAGALVFLRRRRL